MDVAVVVAVNVAVAVVVVEGFVDVDVAVVVVEDAAEPVDDLLPAVSVVASGVGALVEGLVVVDSSRSWQRRRVVVGVVEVKVVNVEVPGGVVGEGDARRLCGRKVSSSSALRWSCSRSLSSWW